MPKRGKRDDHPTAAFMTPGAFLKGTRRDGRTTSGQIVVSGRNPATGEAVILGTDPRAEMRHGKENTPDLFPMPGPVAVYVTAEDDEGPDGPKGATPFEKTIPGLLPSVTPPGRPSLPGVVVPRVGMASMAAAAAAAVGPAAAAARRVAASARPLATSQVNTAAFAHLLAQGAGHISVGDIHLVIDDAHTREFAQQFLIRLTHLREGLSDKDLARALALLDMALPNDDGPVAEEDLGPFYDTASLTALWGVSKQTINKRVKLRTLLGIMADDGGYLYPAFQFKNPDVPENRNGVLPGVREVHDVLADAGESAFTVATWLTAPDPRFGDKAAIDWLREDGDVATVVRTAKGDFTRWGGR